MWNSEVSENSKMRGDLQDKGLKMLKHSLSSTGKRMKKKKETIH